MSSSNEKATGRVVEPNDGRVNDERRQEQEAGARPELKPNEMLKSSRARPATCFLLLPPDFGNLLILSLTLLQRSVSAGIITLAHTFSLRANLTYPHIG
jgi:hypothetical protein